MSYDIKVHDLVSGFIDDAIQDMKDEGKEPPTEKQEKDLKKKLAEHIQGEIEDWLEYTMPRELGK